MIGVVVGDNHPVEAGDLQWLQGGQDASQARLRRTGIDETGRPVGPDDQSCVPLTDIEDVDLERAIRDNVVRDRGQETPLVTSAQQTAEHDTQQASHASMRCN